MPLFGCTVNLQGKENTRDSLCMNRNFEISLDVCTYIYWPYMYFVYSKGKSRLYIKQNETGTRKNALFNVIFSLCHLPCSAVYSLCDCGTYLGKLFGVCWQSNALEGNSSMVQTG